MKRVLFSLAAALALAVPSFAQVAQIGDTTYDTLAKAFAAVAVGGTKTTITVLADAEISETLTVPEGAKVTLNLDGHTLTAPETLTGPVIMNKGSSLTLQTNGNPSAIIAAGGPVIYNYAGTLAGATPAAKGKNLTIKTTAQGDAAIAIVSEGGSVKLSGMTDSLIQGSAGAVGVRGGELSISSALTLDGGTGAAVALSPVNTDITFTTSSSGATFTSAGTAAVIIEGSAPSDGRAVTATVKSGTFTGTGADTVGLRVERNEGEAVDLTIDNGTVAFLKPIIAEGTNPVTGVVVNASFAADALPDAALLADTVAATYPASALEGGITYDDFSSAVRNGSNGKLQEVTLIKDATGEAGGTLSQGRIVKVKLNGHSVAFAEGKGLTVDRASLTIEGEGSLNASGNVAVVTMKGSKTDVTEDCATLVVGKQVTLKGQAGVLVTPNGNAAYGVDVVVNGKIVAVDSGINVNGSINVTEGNVPTITLAETSAVTASATDSVGIYAGGYAIWNLKGAIRAADALSIKCGDITVSGGDYVAFGALSVPPTAATSGSENTGSAVSITTIPNSVYATKTKVTITDGTFTSQNGYALYEGVAQGVQTDATAVDLSITGGTFSGSKTNEDVTADIAVTTASDKQIVSGGTFNTSLPEGLLAPGFVFVPQGDGTFGVIEGTYIASIGDVKYVSLQAAFDAATATDTIKLLSSAIDTPRLTLTNGKTVSIDLNGHDIGFVQNGCFQVNGGKLTLTGEGKVYEQKPYFGAILIKGSTEDVADYSVVDVGKDVTLEGWAPIFIDYNKGYNCAYGVKVTMAGTANSVEDIIGAGGHGVYINGSIKATEGNVPQITLTETSKVTSFGNGIYAAGYAHWTLAGDVSGDDALSIKSGTFTITGGDYRGTGSFADPAEAHGNGSENTGAAVTITTNDSYAQAPIVMDISGTPTFTSVNGYAFYEGIAVNGETPAATASRADIVIKGGSFTGSKTNETITADIAITTAKDKQVVSGGTFNKMPDDALLAPGFVFVPQEDGTFGVIEGTYIASIGEVKYADFNSFLAAFKAIAASETPTTVTLLADLTGELAVSGVVPVAAGQNIVFDLNGHTMETALQQGSSTKHYYAIENSGTLTIKDSSAAQTGTIRARGVSNFAQGNLTVEGGTIIAIDSDKGAALWNEGYAIVSGGKVIVEDLVGNLPAIRNEKNATLVVKGGEVQGQSRPAVINVGTMTIEGGLLWNTQCNVTSDGKHKSPWYYAVLVGGNGNASLKMTGGTIRGTQGALSFIGGKGELTGGRCETVPCIYHGDTDGNIWHALYLSTSEGPVDVTVGGDFVAQSGGREAFVIGGNNEDPQLYTCKATVTGGTFIGDTESGFAALRVNNQRKDGVEPIIQGGHFEGGIVSVADTGFEPITNFVSGGTFSQAVELGYCAEGFIPVAGTDGKYTVDGTAVAAVANTEAPGAYLGYDTLAALVGEAANGTEVLIVKPGNLGEGADLLKTATGGDNATSGATAYDVAETLGGTFAVRNGAIVYAYQLGISKIAISGSDITVAVRLEEAGAPVTRTLAGRKVRVVSDGKTLAEADATFVVGVCELTFSNVADSVVLTIEVLSAAEAETLAE